MDGDTAAVGDINGDGYGDLVVGAPPGSGQRQDRRAQGRPAHRLVRRPHRPRAGAAAHRRPPGHHRCPRRW
ncbi:FG-GAP repeat protein [Streptomyces spiramyceticus]|uniref:FG-GAP repeat protein n=1 Tax=Streptomyces spiramyceticus TaxID=299717 RepID=UPI00237B43CC|nr:FG-GAP repeat protein [Streptomyces spiramyceticus]